MAVVESEGQLVSVERAWSPAVINAGVSPMGYTADYAEIYRTQPAVRTVVQFLARNIAQLGLHVFRRISDTDRVRLADHGLAQTISRPNPATTRYRLMYALVHDLCLYDYAYWVKVRLPNGRIGVVRIPPTKMWPLGENWLWPTGYRLAGNQGTRDLDVTQVVHFRGFDPSDARQGYSPIETIRRLLAEDTAHAEYREQLWRSGARMSGWIERPVESPDWSAPAKQRFRRDWKQRYEEGGTDAGGTPVLEDGMKYHEASYSPKDAQSIEGRKLTREEAAAAFFVAPPFVGLLDRATFSNITELHKMLYQDTLPPWCTSIKEDIELQMLPDFDDVDRVYVEFNLAEKLRGSFEEQASSLQTMVGRPIMTANEGRARVNLPSIDGGDTLVTPLNVLIGGQASPTDSAPKAIGPGTKSITALTTAIRDQHVEQHRQILVSTFNRQRAAVLSALGAGSSTDEAWDTDRWDGELTADLFAAAIAAAAAMGEEVAAAFGAAYNPEDNGLPWLAAAARVTAEEVNGTTKNQIAAAAAGADDILEAAAGVFTTAVEARAPQAAATQVAKVGNFGRVEAATEAGAGTKTWIVTSSAPRASHALMDGETVGMGETFSNGANWPGDPTLDTDERAGCSCTVAFA